MDSEVTGWINGLAGNGFCDGLMMAAAAYGVPVMVALVVLQWFDTPPRARIRHVAIVAGLAFLLGLAINQGVLLFVHRVRPYEAGVTRLLIAKSADWSFPSDHATAAVAIAAAFLAKGVRLRGIVFALMAALIAFSRVYLGIHYVGDVLGGAVTAVLAVMLVVWAYRADNPVDRLLVRIL